MEFKLKEIRILALLCSTLIGISLGTATDQEISLQEAIDVLDLATKVVILVDAFTDKKKDH
jgi:hypothetical protein